MGDFKYHLTYLVDVHKDGLEGDEVMEMTPPRGGCTAVIIHSILFPPSGEYSHLLESRDGRTGEPLSNDELWKAWTMMAATLMEKEDISEGKRALCAFVWEELCNAIAAADAQRVEGTIDPEDVKETLRIEHAVEEAIEGSTPSTLQERAQHPQSCPKHWGAPVCTCGKEP